VIAIHVPPLRQRPGDVPLLVEHFLQLAADARAQPPKQLTAEARDVLLRYSFPGNVRELQNIVERADLLSEGAAIDAPDLPLSARRRPRPSIDQFLTSLEGGWLQLQEGVKELERQLVERAMEAYGDWPNAEIARLLGTSRRVLELRIQEFAINKSRRKA
jgi:DNA-binding NtrC family response regulator